MADIDLGKVVDPLGLFRRPQKQYVGGSKGALEERRRSYERGRTSGINQTGAGLSTLESASEAARGDAARGQETYEYGLGLGERARQEQNAALQSLLRTAQSGGPSLAAAQQEQGVRRLQGAMVAQAAAARGGNQAAAIRYAQGAGSRMGLSMLGNLATLRAQEQAAARDRVMAAQNAIAQAYGQQSAQGLGLIGTGLGASGQATGQLIGIGTNVADVGVHREGQYLSAQQALDALQLEADMAAERSRMGEAGGRLGAASQIWAAYTGNRGSGGNGKG